MSIRPSHRPTLPRSIRPTPLILASALAVAIAAGSLGTLPAAASDRVVVVQAGQTLSEIAAAHGTTVDRLVALNNIADPNRIYAGQRLRVRRGIPLRLPSRSHRAPLVLHRSRLRRDADRDRDALRNHHSRPGHPQPPGRRVTDLRRPAAAHLRSPSPGASRPWRVAAIGRLAAAGPSRQRRSSTSFAPARRCPASPSAIA